MNIVSGGCYQHVEVAGGTKSAGCCERPIIKNVQVILVSLCRTKHASLNTIKFQELALCIDVAIMWTHVHTSAHSTELHMRAHRSELKTCSHQRHHIVAYENWE